MLTREREAGIDEQGPWILTPESPFVSLAYFEFNRAGRVFASLLTQKNSYGRDSRNSGKRGAGSLVGFNPSHAAYAVARVAFQDVWRPAPASGGPSRPPALRTRRRHALVSATYLSHGSRRGWSGIAAAVPPHRVVVCLHRPGVRAPGHPQLDRRRPAQVDRVARRHCGRVSFARPRHAAAGRLAPGPFQESAAPVMDTPTRRPRRGAAGDQQGGRSAPRRRLREW